MKATVESITPRKAKKYLANAENVRQPNPRKVKAMVKDMTNDRWERNGESIKFLSNGSGDVLCDGQNRLQAIIDSGTTQEMVAVRGIDGDTQIDIGQKRSLAQYLKHKGYQYNTLLAAGTSNIAMLLAYQGKTTRDHIYISHAEKIALFHEYEKRLLKFVPECHNTAGLMWRSAVAATLCLGTTASSYPECKDDFMHYLGTGEGMETTDPVYKLRELQLRDMRNKGAKLYGRQRLGLVVKAWNAHRDEQAVENLYFRSGGRNPEVFAKVK